MHLKVTLKQSGKPHFQVPSTSYRLLLGRWTDLVVMGITLGPRSGFASWHSPLVRPPGFFGLHFLAYTMRFRVKLMLRALLKVTWHKYKNVFYYAQQVVGFLSSFLFPLICTFSEQKSCQHLNRINYKTK